MPSYPLLKFVNGSAVPQQAGLEKLRSLSCTSCVAFTGDSRVGKSLLASKGYQELGEPADAFPSATTQGEPVTQGIDIAVLEASDTSIVLWDCEGDNNAQGAIHRIVPVSAALLANLQVHVTGGRVGEQELQSLGEIVAARQVIRVGTSNLPTKPDLVLAVNMQLPSVSRQDLETILAENHEHVPRNVLRASIKNSFSGRRLIEIPLMQAPGFDAQLREFSQIIRGATPFTLEDLPMTGPHVANAFLCIVDQMQRLQIVSFPDVTRVVVLDGYLMPLVGRLFREFIDMLPVFEDYQVTLPDRRSEILGRYCHEAAHVSNIALKEEAKLWLKNKMDGEWGSRVKDNANLGERVVSVETETKEEKAKRFVKKLDWVRNGWGGGGEDIMQKIDVYIVSTRTCTKLRNGSAIYSTWAATAKVERNVGGTFRGHIGDWH